MAYGGETPLPVFVVRAFTFILAAICILAAPRLPKGWLPLDLPASLLVVYAVISTSWAAYPGAAVRLALNMLCAGLVYFLVRSAGERGGGAGEAGRVLAVVLAAASIQAGLAVLQHFSGRGGGLWGTFANSNFLAGYLFFGIVASAHFAFRDVRPGFSARKVFCAIIAALMVFGIYLAKSRAMAAVAAGISLFLVLTARERRRRLYIAGAAAGGALLAAAVAARFSAALDPYAFSRLNIWKAAWKTAVTHPLGVGLGGYKFYWLRFREPIEGAVFRFGKTADTAHSQFFGILSELGFPGILFAVALACAVIVLAWRESRRGDRIMALCLIPLGAMIHALFDVNLDPPAISLAVAACVAMLVNRNTVSERGGVSLSVATRAGALLVLLLCLGYSTAAWIGYSRYGAGLEALKKGDTAGARDGFSMAMRIDPLVSVYPDAVSSVYYRWFLQTGDPMYLSESVNSEQQAVETSPEDPLHRSQLGFLIGELADAVPEGKGRHMFRAFSLSALDQSILRNPCGAVALLRKAEVLRRSGRIGEARETLERLISIEPNAVAAHMAIARLEEADSPRNAAGRYRKAVELYCRLSGMQLEPSQREFIRIDPEEVGRRIEALERGHFPSRSSGQ